MTVVTSTPSRADHDAQSMIYPRPPFATDFPLPKRKQLTPNRHTKGTAIRETAPVEYAAPIEAMGLAQTIIDYSLSVGWTLTSIKAIGYARSTAVLGKQGIDVRFRVVVDTDYVRKLHFA